MTQATPTTAHATASARRLQLSIGGLRRDGSGEEFQVTSPATGEPLATARAATAEDVRAAIDAGAEAFREYRHRPINERAELCRAVARAMLERREAIATDLAMEQGKPLAEALDEVDIAAEMFHAAADNVMRLTGEVIPSSDPAKRVHVTYEPIGVVGVITPWNFPLTIPSEYLSACLAVGNAVVWKPARYTPITAANLAECIAAAGLPHGVINVVYGSGPVVAGALLSHPAVTGIGATGSPATGEALAAAAGTRRLLLELGGNGPAIVLDDADLDKAIARIAFGCFANAGQICDSTERILVHESRRERLLEGLVEEAQQVRLGPSLDAATTMGPLNNEENARKVDAHLDDARARGARIVCGGGRAAGFPTRLYYEPTVIDGVSPEMLLNLEETFGPVAPVLTFRTDDEALALANACEVGLVSGVFTRDLARAAYFAERLETGVVNINEGPTYWQPQTPSGGYAGKRSGLGRIGGRYTLLELTQTKTIVTDIER